MLAALFTGAAKWSITPPPSISRFPYNVHYGFRRKPARNATTVPQMERGVSWLARQILNVDTDAHAAAPERHARRVFAHPGQWKARRNR